MFHQNLPVPVPNAGPQTTKKMPVTLSEMLIQSEIYQDYVKDPSHFRFPVENKSSPIKKNQRNYSQTALLKKIKSYLDILGTGETLDLEKGYCHGITLAWLTMMSLGVEKLFYAIVRQICDCDDSNLLVMTDVITFFLDLIDRGQNPKNYSNNQCAQHNVDEIVGNVDKFDNAELKFKWNRAERKIQKTTEENAMTCVTVWGNRKKDNERVGHTVGLFRRDYKYSFFDPNYFLCKPKKFKSARSVANEIWHRNVRFFGLKTGHGLSAWHRTVKMGDDFRQRYKMV